MHLNVRSLISKISELRYIAVKTNAAVICLSETWLDDSITDGEISIDGYCLVTRDRNRSGRGVCMYIRNDISFSPRIDLDIDGLEVLFCDSRLPKFKPIVIGTCYRSSTQTDFIDKLEESIFKLRSDSEIYLLGDFNICLVYKDSSLCRKYISFMRMFDFNQLISEATRVTSSSSTLIDHILSNTSEKICQFGTISWGLSDHCLIYAARKVVKGQINKLNTVKLKSLRNYCKQDFGLKLSALNWQAVLTWM